MVKIPGYAGWFIQHTINKQKYWYQYIYNPITQKTNQIVYWGKNLPEPNGIMIEEFKQKKGDQLESLGASFETLKQKIPEPKILEPGTLDVLFKNFEDPKTVEREIEAELNKIQEKELPLKRVVFSEV